MEGKQGEFKGDHRLRDLRWRSYVWCLNCQITKCFSLWSHHWKQNGKRTCICHMSFTVENLNGKLLCSKLEFSGIGLCRDRALNKPCSNHAGVTVKTYNTSGYKNERLVCALGCYILLRKVDSIEVWGSNKLFLQESSQIEMMNLSYKAVWTTWEMPRQKKSCIKTRNHTKMWTPQICGKRLTPKVIKNKTENNLEKTQCLF